VVQGVGRLAAPRQQVTDLLEVAGLRRAQDEAVG
jgi:hypothetical protein